MTTAPHVPAPPQGPGVQPPFPAPPVEGRGKRTGWAVGISIGVVVLFCGIGATAVIGIGATANGAYQERARAAVSSYLNALRDKKYDEAYNLLCDDAQTDESPAEFRARVLQPKAQVSRTVFQRAADRGEVRSDLDLDLVAPALAGIVLHRLFVMGEKPGPALIERVIDQIILPAVTPQA